MTATAIMTLEEAQRWWINVCDLLLKEVTREILDNDIKDCTIRRELGKVLRRIGDCGECPIINCNERLWSKTIYSGDNMVIRFLHLYAAIKKFKRIKIKSWYEEYISKLEFNQSQS